MTNSLEDLRKPRAQDLPYWMDNFQRLVEVGVNHFAKRWEKTGIDPASIHTVVQLGPGVGSDLGAFLELFRNAHFHAIDYHSLLHPTLMENSRVTFYQGLFTEVLATTNLPPADLTIMRFVNRTHGFNEENADFLRNVVGKGYLLTSADNGGMEDEQWFRQRFSLHTVLDDVENTMLWKMVTVGNQGQE